ncbi:MAG: response regulator [Ferruginibacter sp.]|nr:response regulator [Cytophagales bacterium]
MIRSSTVEKVITTGKRILIVEDEAISALCLEKMLLQRGYEVVSVVSTAEAAIVRTEELRPDLVLMDIFLPGKMDGIQASRFIHDHCHIPVVFLTAYAQDSLVELAIEAGPFGYLLKPYQEPELYATIEIALLKHRSATYLRELNATRDKFFSIIAHDLRHPLAALFQTTGILKDRLQRVSAQELAFFLEQIHDTAQTLHHLTENLLEWARLQGDRMTFRPAKTNLAALVDYALAIGQGSAQHKRIGLLNTVGRDQWVWADADMLLSAVNNLLSNAVKFSHADGRVTVSARPAGAYLEVSVLDDGVGIEAQFIDRLFHSGSPVTQQEWGTGFGLMLTKEFVARNGGQLSVTSTVGKGTRVTFTLPVSESA